MRKFTLFLIIIPLLSLGFPASSQARTRIIDDVEIVKQRLLCAQALAASECWEEGLTDPVSADLASTLGWGFPTYTGGVMSYIDTMGLQAFITLCDRLNVQTSAGLNPSEWLRRRAKENDRVYPSTA